MKNIWDLIVKFMYTLKDVLQLTSAWRVAMLVVDITLVAFIVYYVIKIIKQTRAEQIVKGILILFLLMVVSKALNLVILYFILTNIMTYGMLLFIVVFQPELRNAFEKLGRKKIVDIFDFDDKLKNKHTTSKEFLLKEQEKLNTQLASADKKISTLKSSSDKKMSQLEAKKDKLKNTYINK